MRAFLLILGVLIASACSKPAPAYDEGRKPRLDFTIWLEPKADLPADALAIRIPELPTGVKFFEQSDLRIGVIRVPDEGDPAPIMERSVGEVHWTKGSAAIIVTTRCLRDLVPTFQKNLLPFWNVALVVGAHCDGPPVEPVMGAAALVETGAASHVRITFDRRTKVFLKVEPLK
jgi:hypothetical protein